MTLVIMAAGLGSRYGGIKQADPLNEHGEFIIDYSIYDAIKAGFDRVVLIIRPEHHEIFKSTIGKRLEGYIKVDYAFQRIDDVPEPYNKTPRQKPWGTVQAVLACRDMIKEPFAVINADDFYGRETFIKMADCLKNAKKSDIPVFSMPGYVLCNTLSKNGHVTRAVCLTSGDDMLSQIVERKRIIAQGSGAAYIDNDENAVELDPMSIVSMNFWGFDERVFDLFKESFDTFLAQNGNSPTAEYVLSTAIGECIAAGKCGVRIIPTDAKWFGVTYAADKPEVTAMLAELISGGVYPDKLF